MKNLTLTADEASDPRVTVIEWDLFLHKDFVMNANDKYPHWSHKAKKISNLKTFGRAHHRRLSRYRRVTMDVDVSYPINRNRDVANLHPTMKHYVDGLVDRPETVKGQKQGPARGILADDDDSQFRGPYLHPTGVRSPVKDQYLFHVRLSVVE